MGGGGDSRIPSILKEYFDGRESECRVNVVVRTYDFNPDVAQGQIAGWVKELRPALVIGESLGAVNALEVRGVPHLFVSPSLNGPIYLNLFAFLAVIPGVTALIDRIYRPKPGDRQTLHFSRKNLHHYMAHRRAALRNLPDSYFAFFGKHDHYRRSGVVSVRTWRRHFGPGTYIIYDGTHFMEEEFIHSLLIPKIIDVLNLPH
ncbi:MAG: hypothetical protein LUC24_07000 [Bacteroidales bacterium]|nr:hypothetical protein [Bacteroidales bacterium]